jgi:hypothetical protein
MANQKYTGMKILRLLLWLLVLSMAAIPSTIPLATTATQFSNVGHPIGDLELILTILLFQLMVFKRNSKSIAVTVMMANQKYTGMKIRLLLWLLVLSMAIPSTIP